MSDRRVLFVRIEPTGYVLALLRALREIWPGEIEAFFTSANVSQQWDLDAEEAGASHLPGDTSRARTVIKSRIMDDPRPALVHTAGWGDRVCQAVIASAHDAKIPVVVDHDTWTDAARGLARIAKSVILPRRLAKISHFAPGGQRQAAFLKRYGVPADKITPVNMTVDVLRIQQYLGQNPNAGSSFRKRYGLPETGRLLLFLGRLVPGKGLEVLLDCWKALTATYPDLHLVVAGDGPLLEEVRGSGQARVHCTGRLSGDEVWDAYAAAHVFVAPSLSEAWGLTINEAMAAGVPVVMSDAFGCIGDLAIADQTACIAQVGNPQDLRACLDRVLKDHVFRRGLQTRATETIANWTIEAQAERIAKIWSSQLAQT